MTAQLLVLAKAPVPGRVKTRLCPPCTPDQAAALAAAALADTLAAAGAAAPGGTVLAVEGRMAPPPGVTVHPQRAGSLGERIAAAFAGLPGPVLQL
ncbi:MAG TPA: glycosyltransferase, partial [Mycobacteriales bacterium]|nr:glycosyltransferase [Mycobacteriales bacterium]